MGIIDVLTYYGATKKAAHAAKTVKHGVSIMLYRAFMGVCVQCAMNKIFWSEIVFCFFLYG